MKGPEENYIMFSKKNNSGRQWTKPRWRQHKDTKAPLGFMILHRHYPIPGHNSTDFATPNNCP